MINNVVEGYNELFDKKKVKYKKKDIEIAFFIGVLVLLFLNTFAGFASAAAPTTPSTISPLDNAIYFNDPTLICSGSTDAESNPINYTFYQRYDDGATSEPTGQATWTYTYSGSADHSEVYDAAAERWNLWLEAGDWDWANLQSDAKFNFTDYDSVWTISWNCDDGGSEFNEATISIDSDIIYTCSVESCCDTSQSYGSDPNIDISDYQDGALHSIRLYLKGRGGTDETTLSFYSRDTLLEVKQNSSSTTFDWEDIDLGSLYLWTCNACDNNSECSPYTDIRNLQTINFSECPAGSADGALNFTLRDEENESMLTGDSSYTITLDSDFDSRTFSDSVDDTNNVTLCLAPGGVNATANGFMEYLPDDGDYTYPRQYYFQDNILNGDNLQNINLYSLKDSLSTAVTFIASRAAQAVQGVLIHLQRYDVATDTFRLVAMGETNANGNDIIYLRLTDAWYRILAYDQGELQFTSGPEHITSTPYSIILSGGAAGQDTYIDFGAWVDLGDISYTLNYSNVSEAFQLVADDVTGASTSMCLKVDKYEMLNGTTNICYTCVDSSSVSISCSLTDLDAYYVGSFIAYDDSTWRVLASLPVDLSGKIAETIGKDGTFFAFLIIGVAAFAAIWSAAASITLALLGFATMTTLGFLDIAWQWVMGLIMAGIILMSIMYKRRTM